MRSNSPPVCSLRLRSEPKEEGAIRHIHCERVLLPASLPPASLPGGRCRVLHGGVAERCHGLMVAAAAAAAKKGREREAYCEKATDFLSRQGTPLQRGRHLVGELGGDSIA